MKWEHYVSQFNQTAKQQGYDDTYIQRCLTYAHRLYIRNAPIIYDQKHLSLLVGYSYRFLRAASQTPQRFYQYFEIAKKTGGTRKIAEPLPSLKQIQIGYCRKFLTDANQAIMPKLFSPDVLLKKMPVFIVNNPMYSL